MNSKEVVEYALEFDNVCQSSQKNKIHVRKKETNCILTEQRTESSGARYH